MPKPKRPAKAESAKPKAKTPSPTPPKARSGKTPASGPTAKRTAGILPDTRKTRPNPGTTEPQLGPTERRPLPQTAKPSKPTKPTATKPTKPKPRPKTRPKKPAAKTNPFTSRGTANDFIRQTLSEVQTSFASIRTMVETELAYLNKLKPDTAVIEARVACISALKTITTANAQHLIQLTAKLDLLADLRDKNNGPSTTIVFNLGDNTRIPVWQGDLPEDK